MAKREFLQLAHVFNGMKHSVGGWFMSEKLDGMRAFWDGGITRGIYADQVPWANVEKDGRLVNRPIATGLWSRYGKVIYVPDEWTQDLPAFPLDGELYIPPSLGGFQKVVSVVKQHNGSMSSGWANVDFMVLDLPPFHAIFANGEINNTNFKKKLVGITGWAQAQLEKVHGFGATVVGPNNWQFKDVCTWLKEEIERNPKYRNAPWLKFHEQTELPYNHGKAMEVVQQTLDEVTSSGGEGIILRNPTTFWVPQRSHSVLKIKQVLDDEAEVIGYVWGRETDLGSKLLGLMGALIVNFRGKKLELSGFTDDERQMHWIKAGLNDQDRSAYEDGKNFPGQEVGIYIENRKFPRGSKVTFKYRELTDTGIPKEARYWRKAE